ncbi:hypothetical protein HPP92_025342, partial [Vanilla planifolia]
MSFCFKRPSAALLRGSDLIYRFFASTVAASEHSSQLPVSMKPAEIGATLPSLEVFMVTSEDSPEFSRLDFAVRHSSVVGLDAEWKPFGSRRSVDGSAGNGGEPSFPTVTLLQIACRFSRGDAFSLFGGGGNPIIFLVDLLSVRLGALWELLREMFVSPSVLKLGFRFKQDLVYLSSTFASQGFHSGFDRVEPFIDITSMYYYFKYKNTGKNLREETKSLATICREILGICLSKEFQRSDWSYRPLTEGQISYAVADVHYLLEIFNVFEQKLLTEGVITPVELSFSDTTNGLKEISMQSNACKNNFRIKLCSAVDMMKSSYVSQQLLGTTAIRSTLDPSCETNCSLNENIFDIVKKYGERIILKESDKKPRISRRKGERRSFVHSNSKEQFDFKGDWQGLPPWNHVIGGDGCPRFLCDVMVQGLARHLRCVGIDAATPSLKKPEPRQLLDQTHKEKRVLLTRDSKLLKHQYLVNNQVYKVKSLLKEDQLLE